MKFREYLAVVFFLLVTPTVIAQPLWGGTEYGMSVEQVKIVVPEAIAPAKSETLRNGAVELLRLEGLEIVGKQFSARFFFLQDKLNQVTLSLARETADFNSVVLTFDSVTEALRAKYGRE